jgi:hypothetical protein
MSSTDGSGVRDAGSARDRALATLRRARRVTALAGVAATFGFTVLAARAFPGHAKPRQGVASLTPRHLAPARPHHRARRHRRPTAASAAPQPVAPAPQPVAPAGQPAAPAPQPVAPAPTPQPPVVSSGGS